MNDKTLDSLRNLRAPQRGGEESDRRAHLIDANRLLKAFIQIEDSPTKVIELAERLTKQV
jgi:hypothetical protein